MTHAPKAAGRRPLAFALDGRKLLVYVREPRVRTNALGLAHRMMHSPDLDYVRRRRDEFGQVVTLRTDDGSELDFAVTETLADDVACSAFVSDDVPAFEIWAEGEES